jgi:hypothetical protein
MKTDVEENEDSLSWNTIPLLVWKDREKTRKASVSIVNPGTEIRTQNL